MFLKLLDKGHGLRSSVTKPSQSSKLALEPLESRSLLDANSFVASLYANILQRATTGSEVSGWVAQINAGLPLQSVTAAIVDSTEHLADIVQDDYSNFLGRSAGPQEVNYWAQQISAGLSQDGVAAQILTSDEFFQKNGSAPQAFVEALYKVVLHRPADQPGLEYWVGQIEVHPLSKTANAAIALSKTSYEEVAQAIVQSDEAHLHEVDAFYAQLLHRAPDSSGELYWTTSLDAGGSQSQVIEGMVDSLEYLTSQGMNVPLIR